MNLWLIFLTGLTVGGLTCMVVQGGLLASTIAAREEEDLLEGKKRKHTLWPILAFLVAKLLAYTLLGFFLGWFGASLSLSDSARVILQVIASIYMLLIAFNLLNLHPIFRYAVIQPPRFLTKLVRNQSKSKEVFAPALLGLLTIFIPCGTTLAIEAFAISSGNPWLGAIIMAVFVLGTSPLFFILGFLTTRLGDAFHAKFFKVAAILVIYLGLSSLNGALILAGSPITWQTIASYIPIEIDLNASDSSEDSNSLVKLIDGVQTASIKVMPTGYSPNFIRVKSGLPVKLNLATQGGLGCTSSFRIPKLGISRELYSKGSDSVEFTPQNKGKLTWTCSMGMYFGTIEII
ncbi:sulfite exporter TauE/SafE family protein [Candidatus Daviesbacteria bacterium]|nr:sulfite exporter TauE/SafE family protein [Candidatus Daviesbacteria bacterium]